MKDFRKNKFIKCFSLILVFTLMSQQLGWTRVEDLRDEGEIGTGDVILSICMGAATALLANPSGSAYAIFAKTYLTPIVANWASQKLDIENPYAAAAFRMGFSYAVNVGIDSVDSSAIKAGIVTDASKVKYGPQDGGGAGAKGDEGKGAKKDAGQAGSTTLGGAAQQLAQAGKNATEEVSRSLIRQLWDSVNKICNSIYNAISKAYSYIEGWIKAFFKSETGQGAKEAVTKSASPWLAALYKGIQGAILGATKEYLYQNLKKHNKKELAEFLATAGAMLMFESTGALLSAITGVVFGVQDGRLIAEVKEGEALSNAIREELATFATNFLINYLLGTGIETLAGIAGVKEVGVLFSAGLTAGLRHAQAKVEKGDKEKSAEELDNDQNKLVSENLNKEDQAKFEEVNKKLGQLNKKNEKELTPEEKKEKEKLSKEYNKLKGKAITRMSPKDKARMELLQVLRLRASLKAQKRELDQNPSSTGDFTKTETQINKLERQIAQQDYNIAEKTMSLKAAIGWGLLRGGISVGLQKISSDFDEPVMGYYFNFLSSSLVKALIMSHYVSGLETKPGERVDSEKFRDSSLDRAVPLNQGAGFWGSLANFVKTLKLSIGMDMTAVVADWWSMGRCTADVRDGSMNLRLNNPYDAFFASRYNDFVQGVAKDKKDKNAFMWALSSQYLSSLHYQSVRNVNDIGRHLFYVTGLSSTTPLKKDIVFNLDRTSKQRRVAYQQLKAIEERLKEGLKEDKPVVFGDPYADPHAHPSAPEEKKEEKEKELTPQQKLGKQIEEARVKDSLSSWNFFAEPYSRLNALKRNLEEKDEKELTPEEKEVKQAIGNMIALYQQDREAFLYTGGVGRAEVLTLSLNQQRLNNPGLFIQEKIQEAREAKWKEKEGEVSQEAKAKAKEKKEEVEKEITQAYKPYGFDWNKELAPEEVTEKETVNVMGQDIEFTRTTKKETDTKKAWDALFDYVYTQAFNSKVEEEKEKFMVFEPVRIDFYEDLFGNSKIYSSWERPKPLPPPPPVEEKKPEPPKEEPKPPKPVTLIIEAPFPLGYTQLPRGLLEDLVIKAYEQKEEKEKDGFKITNIEIKSSADYRGPLKLNEEAVEGRQDTLSQITNVLIKALDLPADAVSISSEGTIHSKKIPYSDLEGLQKQRTGSIELSGEEKDTRKIIISVKPTTPQTLEWTPKEGETISHLAKKVQKEYYPDADVSLNLEKQITEYLKATGQIKDDKHLRAGKTYKVPLEVYREYTVHTEELTLQTPKTTIDPYEINRSEIPSPLRGGQEVQPSTLPPTAPTTPTQTRSIQHQEMPKPEMPQKPSESQEVITPQPRIETSPSATDKKITPAELNRLRREQLERKREERENQNQSQPDPPGIVTNKVEAELSGRAQKMQEAMQGIDNNQLASKVKIEIDRHEIFELTKNKNLDKLLEIFNNPEVSLGTKIEVLDSFMFGEKSENSQIFNEFLSRIDVDKILEANPNEDLSRTLLSTLSRLDRSDILTKVATNKSYPDSIQLEALYWLLGDCIVRNQSSKQLLEPYTDILISVLHETKIQFREINHLRYKIVDYLGEEKSDLLRSLMVDPEINKKVRGDIATKLVSSKTLGLSQISELINDKVIPLEVREQLVGAYKAINSVLLNRVLFAGRVGRGEPPRKEEIEQKEEEAKKQALDLHHLLGQMVGDNRLEESLRKEAISVLRESDFKYGREILREHRPILVGIVKDTNHNQEIKDEVLGALIDMDERDTLRNLQGDLVKLPSTERVSTVLDWIEAERVLPKLDNLDLEQSKKYLESKAKENITNLFNAPQRDRELKKELVQLLFQLKDFLSQNYVNISNYEWEDILYDIMFKANLDPEYQTITSNFRAGMPYLEGLEKEVGKDNSRIATQAIWIHEMVHNALYSKNLFSARNSEQSCTPVLHEFIADLAANWYLQSLGKEDVIPIVHNSVEYSQSARQAAEEMTEKGSVDIDEPHLPARAQLEWLKEATGQLNYPLEWGELFKNSLQILDEHYLRAQDPDVNNIEFSSFIKELSVNYLVAMEARGKINPEKTQPIQTSPGVVGAPRPEGGIDKGRIILVPPKELSRPLQQGWNYYFRNKKE